MIADPQRLREVTEEIADWTLEQRKAYIVSIEQAYCLAAAQQIRDALTRFWVERKGKE